MPFAAHRAEHVAAQRPSGGAVASPVEGIELEQHGDGRDEAAEIGPGRDDAGAVLGHEIERDGVNEEGLECYVEITKHGHQLIERRVALVENRIGDRLKRLHAGEIEKADPESERFGVLLERRIGRAGDPRRRQHR